MEYDKSRVYTALNADELKVGSRVVVADNVSNLKYNVAQEIDITTLTNINSEDCMMRFKAGDGLDYAFAYLVSEPAEKILTVDDLKLGDVIRNKNDKSEYIIIGVSPVDNCIFFAGGCADSYGLKNWEKVE